jgi:hypothetical protein
MHILWSSNSTSCNLSEQNSLGYQLRFIFEDAYCIVHKSKKLNTTWKSNNGKLAKQHASTKNYMAELYFIMWKLMGLLLKLDVLWLYFCLHNLYMLKENVWNIHQNTDNSDFWVLSTHQWFLLPLLEYFHSHPI